MSKLSLQGPMEGSIAAHHMLALEAPRSSNPYAASSHAGEVMPVKQTLGAEPGKLRRVQTASSCEEDLGNGMRDVMDELSAPASVLRSQAESFLQARGTDPARKGTKRKVSETSLKKRPAAAGSKVRKTVNAPAPKRPSASKAPLRQVAARDLTAGKQWTNRSFAAKQWGHCRVEFYSAKSYIRFFCEKKARMCMVIGSVHGQHQETCDRLVPHVQKGKSREKLLEIRAQLEKSFEGKDV